MAFARSLRSFGLQPCQSWLPLHSYHGKESVRAYNPHRMPVAETIILAVACYATLGVVFAIWFVFRGVERFDPVAQGGPVSFRLLILPGSAALWPLLLIRCLRQPGKGPA